MKEGVLSHQADFQRITVELHLEPIDRQQTFLEWLLQIQEAETQTKNF